MNVTAATYEGHKHIGLWREGCNFVSFFMGAGENSLKQKCFK